MWEGLGTLAAPHVVCTCVIMVCNMWEGLKPSLHLMWCAHVQYVGGTETLTAPHVVCWCLVSLSANP